MNNPPRQPAYADAIATALLSLPEGYRIEVHIERGSLRLQLRGLNTAHSTYLIDTYELTNQALLPKFIEQVTDRAQEHAQQ